MNKLAYTVPEFAEAIGIGRSKVYEEIKAGRLIATKCGGRTLIKGDHARAWLDNLPPSAPRAA